MQTVLTHVDKQRNPGGFSLGLGFVQQCLGIFGQNLRALTITLVHTQFALWVIDIQACRVVQGVAARLLAFYFLVKHFAKVGARMC